MIRKYNNDNRTIGSIMTTKGKSMHYAMNKQKKNIERLRKLKQEFFRNDPNQASLMKQDFTRSESASSRSRQEKKNSYIRSTATIDFPQHWLFHSTYHESNQALFSIPLPPLLLPHKKARNRVKTSSHES